jgi:hypothetical protein
MAEAIIVAMLEAKIEVLQELYDDMRRISSEGGDKKNGDPHFFYGVDTVRGSIAFRLDRLREELQELKDGKA